MSANKSQAQANTDSKTPVPADFNIVAAKLTTKVDLDLGATTVESALQSLANQTGLQIQAETYLLKRPLMVHLRHCTAEEALDALVEMNDWRWINRGNRQVLVTRKRVTIPQNLKELPACLLNAFPKDYRTFLGFGTSVKDLPEIKTPGASMPLHNPDPQAERSSRVRGRLQTIQSRKAQALFIALQPGILNDQPFCYKDLSPQMQIDLQDTLLLQMLGMLANEPYLRLLNTGLMPYQQDPNTVEISLYGGNLLLIGSPVNGSSAFFGTAIPELKPTKPVIPSLENPIPVPNKP